LVRRAVGGRGVAGAVDALVGIVEGGLVRHSRGAPPVVAPELEDGEGGEARVEGGDVSWEEIVVKFQAGKRGRWYYPVWTKPPCEGIVTEIVSAHTAGNKETWWNGSGKTTINEADGGHVWGQWTHVWGDWVPGEVGVDVIEGLQVVVIVGREVRRKHLVGTEGVGNHVIARNPGRAGYFKGGHPRVISQGYVNGEWTRAIRRYLNAGQ
jgi:hypothetical protein